MLADADAIGAAQAQQALRIFAGYDLSVPRMLPAGLLDEEYEWTPGSTAKLLGKLARLQLIVPVGRLWMLAPEYTWTPETLAEQWREMEAAQERARMTG